MTAHNIDNDIPTAEGPDDFQVAVTAVTRALRAINADQRGGAGAEFVTHLLATVAANLGSSDALIAARPGSWEAAGVADLLRSTVGSDDEYLLTFRTGPIELVVNSVYELDDLGIFETYEASTNHIGHALFGDRWSRSRDRLTLNQLEQIEDIEEQLVELEKRDRAEYQHRFAATVRARFEQLRADYPGRYPEHLAVTVRFADDNTSNDDLTDGWGLDLASRLYQYARETTPLPGSDTAPDWTASQSHAETLLAAGHWPHLRIPTLAHYGTPTTAPNTLNTDKES
ncbi:hypothetical protein [Kribbella sp. VKM Ac-2568]|uniref:hypothetical protein n=1 Tax=Kribbella sp. VKM Ac-2568 TaxID=2512219 RepID=UPI0010442DC7|nr:hypothetical protein [Kribbella sp. VKM Ac-2568]TCM35123.1 hypothetical protein EV648_12516 [Kribbella sp. VKM Ac-2568]